MTIEYLLSQGQADVHRLGILNQVYGPPTEAILLELGLKPGLHVVEIGCGSGNMTCWLAQQVGPTGRVTGIDFSPDAIVQARQQATSRGLTNIDFATGDVNALTLPPHSFDIAYCRCVLMHQRQPELGLGQMARLVRPGGFVLCEELDLSRCFFDPPAPHMTRMMELQVAIGERHNASYRLGSRLNSLFQKTRLDDYQIKIHTPTILRGPTKALLSLSFRQFAANLVEAGLTQQAEFEQILAEATRTDADAKTMYAMPPMSQGWARIP